MFTLPYTEPPDDLLKLYIHSTDITDHLIGDSIQIRNSTDYPYFSDSEIGDASISLASLNDEFNPLNPDNLFRQFGTADDKWDQYGYKVPVVLSSKGQTLFAGHIIDVNIDLEHNKVDLTLSDFSKDYREKDLGVSEFGIQRHLLLDEGDQYAEYPLPKSAAPIYEESVKLRPHGDALDAPQVTDLHAEGDHADDEYTVQPDEPLIVARDAYDRTDDQSEPPKVSFYEPHRWRKIESIVKDLLDLIDPAEELKGNAEVEIPKFNTGSPEFVTNGRVGWHIEGIDEANPTRWGYTGFVRDFVVNPANGDAFFLYGGAYHRNKIVQYISSEDRYVSYEGPSGQSLWRIATSDFDTFFIAGAATYPEGETGTIAKRITHEFGPNFDSISTADNDDKPKIYKWVLSDPSTWNEVDWVGDSGGVQGNGPQLANFIGLTAKTVGLSLTDRTTNPENIRADTRDPFIVVGDRLLFKSRIVGASRVIQYDISQSLPNHADHVRTTDVANAQCNFGYGYTFGYDDTYIYICTVDGTSLNLTRVPFGSSTSEQLLNVSRDTLGLAGKHLWNLTDIVVTESVGNTKTVYGVLQYADNDHSVPTQGKLFAFTSTTNPPSYTPHPVQLEGSNWDFRYALGPKGGVKHRGNAYYFLGSIYQQISSYDSLSKFADGSIPNTGRLISITANSHNARDRGLVWRSAVLPREWEEEPDADRYTLKSYGAHNSIIAPLKSTAPLSDDTGSLHMVAGYGDVQDSIKKELELSLQLEDDLIEFPADHIDNWQWIQWGTKHPMRLDRVVIGEGEKVWDFLIMLAELTQCSISMNGQKFSFKRQPGVYTKITNDSLSETGPGPIPVSDASIFPSSGTVLIGSELIKYDSQLSGLQRGIYPTTAQSHLAGDYVYLIDKVADNYSAEQNILHISFDGKYEELYNQIKGSVRHAISHSLSPEMKEYTKQRDSIVDRIGELPFDIDTQLLSHHQLWWRDALAEHYLNEFTSLSFDVSLELTYMPGINVGDTIAIDVKHPAKDGTEWIWRKGSVDWVAARVVQIEQNVGLGDSAWTTSIVARTLPLD